MQVLHQSYLAISSDSQKMSHLRNRAKSIHVLQMIVLHKLKFYVYVLLLTINI